MTETARQVELQDRQFVRRMIALLVFWTAMFLIASAGLVTYGDVLMNLFA